MHNRFVAQCNRRMNFIFKWHVICYYFVDALVPINFYCYFVFNRIFYFFFHVEEKKKVFILDVFPYSIAFTPFSIKRVLSVIEFLQNISLSSTWRVLLIKGYHIQQKIWEKKRILLFIASVRSIYLLIYFSTRNKCSFLIDFRRKKNEFCAGFITKNKKKWFLLCRVDNIERNEKNHESYIFRWNTEKKISVFLLSHKMNKSWFFQTQNTCFYHRIHLNYHFYSNNFVMFMAIALIIPKSRNLNLITIQCE